MMLEETFESIVKLLEQYGQPEQIAYIKNLKKNYERYKAQNFIYMVAMDKQPTINVYYDRPKK